MKIIPTSDGSVTVYNEALDETYHSIHGAIQEARHVFIKNGLETFPDNTIDILEVGLGTGLNLFLTYLFTHEEGIKVNYTALEPHPLPLEFIKELNYPALLEAEESRDVFFQIHKIPADQIIELSTRFKLNKINKPVSQWESDHPFDLIYFDAFGPRAQPEMWLPEVFEKMYAVLKPGGILVTYCAKGEVKRNLKNIGFNVETLSGPPGKREMTRARKHNG